MNLGKSLEIALAKRGMSKGELADKMNVSPQHVSIWINKGRISHKNLVKVCELLNFSVSKFVALGEK